MADIKIKKIHLKLLTDISDHMVFDSPECRKFTKHLELYVPKGMQAEKKTLLDKLGALEINGNIKEGDYKVLKEVCEESRNMDIVRIIEKAEGEIEKVKQDNKLSDGKQRDGFEAPVPDVPSTPIPSSASGASTKYESAKDNLRFPVLTQARHQIHGDFFDTHGHIEKVLDLETIVQASSSVCKIWFGTVTATGFRVGSSYVMTAGHVTYSFVKDYASLYAPEYYAVFNYKEEGVINEDDKYMIKDVVYSNPETDISVIELHSNRMPPPFTHFTPPVCEGDRMRLIGHSQGKPMESNLVTKIVDKDNQEIKDTLEKLQDKSIKHTNGRGLDIGPPDNILNPKRYLFHCKFTKGASGSPGIVRIGRKIYVATVLLHGYPDWYYDPRMKKYKADWQDDHRVEQGANLWCVREMMKETHPELFEDIFGEQLRQENN